MLHALVAYYEGFPPHCVWNALITDENEVSTMLERFKLKLDAEEPNAPVEWISLPWSATEERRVYHSANTSLRIALVPVVS